MKALARFIPAAAVALTGNPAGNAVVACPRTPDGALTRAGSYRTGGLGGEGIAAA